ncbi:glycoside hydrolase family 16 protein [Arachidicoccus soli]|uniref:Glycoside hydrolase family 16 protein n=1 Tax=Arachidicoccus soli TaxID=2341117 RepID=A0A386HML6_9BACT|nr:glycoside hydrolase family 16 protein [Arachidicoccus soli]AYD46770.1 glycoside hydrolase family 16 protein [Arachidicoccus soli]
MKYSTTFFLFSFLMLFNHSFGQKKYNRMVWHEEFNYTGLPDSTIWNYENGFVRNQESQYYTKARKENAYVHDGYLEIKAIKENYPNKFYLKGSTDWRKKAPNAAYTSACITTKNLHTWRYGKIVVRAKLPMGLGVWPAIWMLGAEKYKWPRNGEIDIMELIGREPTHIYGTAHYAADNKSGHKSSGGVISVNDLSDAFHNYAVVWNKHTIKFMVDDSVYHSFNTSPAKYKGENPFRKKFYLLLNLAMGGSWGGPIGENVLPQSFLVDYVRIYK